MIFSREYVNYLARQTVDQLIEAKMIRAGKVAVGAERVNAAILEELSLEDRINEEVRVILDAYQEDMRRTGASYAEMFKKVKQELARKYKAVLWDCPGTNSTSSRTWWPIRSRRRTNVSSWTIGIPSARRPARRWRRC